MASTAPVHPHSHVVVIYRKNSFSDDAQMEKAADFIANSRKSIGSYWESSYSKSMGSGLNFSEQKLLMPHVVDCEPEDRNFRKAVSDYFASIKTAVPYSKGRDLEIGLEKGEKEPLSKDNMPINLYDYITYRHAKGHPQVAGSRAEADGNPLVMYYIFDKVEEEGKQAQVADLKDKVLELYLTVRKESKKADMLLTILGIDPRKYTGMNAPSQKMERLRQLAESDPVKFKAAFEHKKFDDLYTIQTMLNTGILKQVGEFIVNAETGKTIGHTTEEAIAWLTDKANSQQVTILKARMQEMLAPEAEAPATEKAK